MKITIKILSISNNDLSLNGNILWIYLLQIPILGNYGFYLAQIRFIVQSLHCWSARYKIHVKMLRTKSQHRFLKKNKIEIELINKFNTKYNKSLNWRSKISVQFKKIFI